MNTQPRRWSRLSIALSLLLFAAACLLLLVLNAARRQQTGQVEPPQAQVAVDSPLPTPAPPSVEMIVITPPPDGGVIVLPPAKPGQVYAFPSPTPIPTWTPRPTPTRRPGSTATAMPLAKPALNAAGLIYFTTDTGNVPQTVYSQFSLPMDGQGEAVGNLEAIGAMGTLDFVPYQILISPDRRYTLYMQAVEPGLRPHVHNNATGETRILFEKYSGGQFWGWHPDGRRFLFWIDDVGLWLIDAETIEMTTLAYPEGPVQGAAISPDGLTVAYIAQDQPTLGAMWFVSAAGSDAKPQFDAGGTSFMYPNAWSPTNDRLIYSGNCPPSLSETQTANTGPLCIFHRSEQTFQSLNLPYAGYPPSWSPDGRYIAATGLGPDERPCEKSENRNNPEKCIYQGRSIYIVDTATSDVVSLASGIAPIWSPDGSRIAFLSDRTGRPEVWIITVDGEGEQQMTTIGSYILPHTLSWLPEVR